MPQGCGGAGEMTSKYRAKRTRCLHGHMHDSKREATRCDELMLLFRAGQIRNLEIQPPAFKLLIKGQLIESYRPDFIYFEDSQRVVEDVKGYKTKDYRRKKKWMLALYNVEIRET